jgi:flagellar basal-body rod protein FlgB
MNDIFGTKILENALSAATLRQQVISNNIANVNTPGFRPAAVAFEEQLKQAMMAQNEEGFEAASEEPEPEHIPITLSLDPGAVQASISQGEGQVDVNKEMTNQAKNQILHAALVGKISGYLGSLSYVIDNSGR